MLPTLLGVAGKPSVHSRLSLKAAHGALEGGGSVTLLQQKELRLSGGSPVQNSKDTQISRCASVPTCVTQKAIVPSGDRNDVRSIQGSPVHGVCEARRPTSPIFFYKPQVASPQSVTTSAGSCQDLRENVTSVPSQVDAQSEDPLRPDLRIKKWQEMEHLKASSTDTKEQALVDSGRALCNCGPQGENLLYATSDELCVTMLSPKSPRDLSTSSSLQTIPPSPETIAESCETCAIREVQHGVPATLESRVEELCLTVRHHHDMHVGHANLFQMLRGEVNTLRLQVSDALSNFEVLLPQLKGLAQELMSLKDSTASQKHAVEESLQKLRLDVDSKLGDQSSRFDPLAAGQDAKEGSQSMEILNKHSADAQQADGGRWAEDVQQLAKCVRELHMDRKSLIIEFDSEMRRLKEMMEGKILALQSSLDEQLKDGRMITYRCRFDAEGPQGKHGEQASKVSGVPPPLMGSRTRSWFSSPRHELSTQFQYERAASVGAREARMSSPNAEQRIAVARTYSVSRQSSCPQQRSRPPSQVCRKTCGYPDEHTLRQRAQAITQQQQPKLEDSCKLRV